MKRRFTVTLCLTLLFSTVLVSFIHFHFFNFERMRLIDQHIGTLASAILASGLQEEDLHSIERVEKEISHLFSSEPNVPIIVIANSYDQIVFRNSPSVVLGSSISLEPDKQTIRLRTHTIRLHRVRIQPSGYKLFVGLVLDRGQIQWRRLSVAVVYYIAFILAIVVGASYFSAGVLLQPLRNLAALLSHITHANAKEADSMLAKISPNIDERDELGQLVKAAREVNILVNQHLARTQNWTAKMAHELKTPLTIIKNSVEMMKKNPNEQSREQVMREVDHINQIISSFIEWARIGSGTPSAESIYAVNIDQSLKDLSRDLNSAFDGRIEIQGTESTKVFCHPDHAQMLLSNLLSNALKYSSVTSKVIVNLKSGQLTIQDFGSGIDPEVLKNLGQPFNTGTSGAGHGTGLGLAWVHTISNLYHWKLKFDSTRTGTVVTVDFNV